MKLNKKAKESYFFSQPHQPFFILAFINAIVTMFLFMLSFKGLVYLKVSAATFHSYSMLYLLFTPAFTAFLFTTFPKFTSTPPIPKKNYIRVFALFCLGTVLFIAGSITSSLFLHIGMLSLLLGHTMIFRMLYNIYKTTTISDKHDIFWILFAIGWGLLSHLLFVTASLFYTPLMELSIEIGIYLYLFLLTFSVAQRMVPFFSHCIYEKNINLLKTVFVLLTVRLFLETIYTGSAFVVELVLAYIIGKEILSWRLPFPNPNPLLWILHLSLYWIPIAFIFGAMSNLTALISNKSFLFLDTHVLMLGFVFTILIGFGTRVTIGHSGNLMQAGVWEKVLFNWTQVVVVMRLFVSMATAFGWDFMILFDISATVWMIMFILWGIRFFPLLTKGKKLN